MKVFVSYTLKDPAITKEKLKKVEERIKPCANVFIDILHNEKRKQSHVERELHRCDVLLHLESPKYNSEWVENELLAARKEGKTIIKIEVDEFLNMDQEQVYLLISEVDKKGWSVWSILIASLLACVTISIIGIWLSYLFVSNHIVVGTGSDIMNARGLFGDSWGGVNAIVSAFAFAGVIVTLFLQNRDLNLQRKEMARQREEFEKENKTLKYQRFENLFYNMLNLQQEIVADLRFDYMADEQVLVTAGPYNTPTKNNIKVNHSVTGREVFWYTFREAEICCDASDQSENTECVTGYRSFLNKKGLGAYDNTWIPSCFDHYFRHLYKIIQFVDSQEFPFREAYKYVSMLRGTLSRYELVWIYYNTLNPSFERFKRLIEKYSLLKNIRMDLLTRCAETDQFFSKHGLTPRMVCENGFSGYDFELYITDNATDGAKYQLSAFWKGEEIVKGKEYLDRWNAFVNNAK